MIKIAICTITASILLFSNVAFAKMNKADLDVFCAQQENEITKGLQPDGKKANEDLMALQAGEYSVPSGHRITLNEGFSYYVEMPSGAGMGGCSKEQLSEILQNNHISIEGLQEK